MSSEYCGRVSPVGRVKKDFWRIFFSDFLCGFQHPGPRNRFLAVGFGDVAFFSDTGLTARLAVEKSPARLHAAP